MARRKATFTQADVARAIRAAQAAGAPQIEIIGQGEGAKIIIRLISTDPESRVEMAGEIVL